MQVVLSGLGRKTRREVEQQQRGRQKRAVRHQSLGFKAAPAQEESVSSRILTEASAQSEHANHTLHPTEQNDFSFFFLFH